MKKLSLIELMEVFEYEQIERNARLEKITAEIERRKANAQEVKLRMWSGAITVFEAQSILEDLEIDIARCKELEAEAVKIRYEVLEDLKEIMDKMSSAMLWLGKEKG